MEVIIYVSIITVLAVILLISMIKHNHTKEESNRNSQEIVRLSTELQNTKTATARLEQEKANSESRMKQVEKTNNELSVQNGKLEERIRVITDEAAVLRKESEARFNILAQQILEEKSKAFKEANETRLKEILNPLKENIESFKKDINDKYIKDHTERNQLQEHIKQLQEMNDSISKEAKELSKALRGNTKIQGDWGEMILQTILEKSGLVEGENYKIQATTDENGETIKNENGGQLRPDVILNMPDGRNLIIDSKTSLTNYVNYINAEDTEEQKKYLSLHIASVRSHIKELKVKKYQDYVKQSGNFVMMFIPNEGAYIAAMQADPELWQYAYDNRVTIISPTHLISTLKLIHQIWQHDKQTKNAIEIADESGKLYDKFAGFVNDLEKIGKSIDNSQKQYDDAMKKLKTGSGNLIGRVEKLKDMGAKATKLLPNSADSEKN